MLPNLIAFPKWFLIISNRKIIGSVTPIILYFLKKANVNKPVPSLNILPQSVSSSQSWRNIISYGILIYVSVQVLKKNTEKDEESETKSDSSDVHYISHFDNIEETEYRDEIENIVINDDSSDNEYINNIAEYVTTNELHGTAYHSQQMINNKYIPRTKENSQFLNQCLSDSNIFNEIDPTIIKRKLLTEGCGVYSSIKKMFSNKFKVMEIFQIENPYLLIQYGLKKIEYLNKYGAVQEKLLFHGTKENNVESIVKENFDWRKTKQWHKYGLGVYFTQKPSIASRFSDKSTTKAMFYVKVLISSQCIGEKNMPIPPDNTDTTTNRKKTEYVKYDDNSFYPLYLIYYINKHQ